MASAEGKVITILSIDGGGIRGLIPAVILSTLEEELQRIDRRPDARIADYFDIVAGTSTGSIIAAFLTAPFLNSNSNCPRPRKARDIKDFYREHSPKIFPEPIETGNSEIEPDESQQKEQSHWWQHLGKEFVQFVKGVRDHLRKRLLQDKYPLSEIGKIVDEQLEEIQLAQTLTNVVIPAYDIQTLRLISFSSRQKREENSSIKLKDVVMGSAAAPTYFPPHEFEADGTKYSLVDGGLAANNPTLLAIGEAARMFGPPDGNNYLILSLGTGTEGKDQNSLIGLRGALPWMLDFEKWSSPLVELLFRISSDMVDEYTSSLLSVGGWNSKQNCFLRIQDHSLKNEQLIMDDASQEHMDSLIDIGKKLLDKHVSYPSLGIDTSATNRDALSRFARMLSDEKKKRERGSTSSHVLSGFGFMTYSTICLLLLLFIYKLCIVFYQ